MILINIMNHDQVIILILDYLNKILNIRNLNCHQINKKKLKMDNSNKIKWKDYQKIQDNQIWKDFPIKQ